MTSKEKQVAAGGCLILAAIMAVRFVIQPTNEDITKAQAVIADGDKALQDLRGLSAECLRLKAELDQAHERIARHPGNADALSVLEAMGKACGLTQRNVAYMRPEAAVIAEGYAQGKTTIRLEGISEAQMKQFLRRIQSSDLPMGVRSLDLTVSRKNLNLLDATIEVVSVTPAGGA